MSKKHFEDLLNKYESKYEKNEIDWEAKKDEWLGFVKQFYSSVESWLKLYKNDGKLSYEFKKTNITEDYIGTYDVDLMVVDFAGQQINMEPMGTLLIGTKGRIDMEGARGRVQFILADKDSKGMKTNVLIAGESVKTQGERKEPDWAWKIVLRESRKISYVEFNEENFFDALMEIVNG